MERFQYSTYIKFMFPIMLILGRTYVMIAGEQRSVNKDFRLDIKFYDSFFFYKVCKPK